MWVYPCMEVYPPPTPIWKYTHTCGYTPIWGVYTYMCYTPLWGYTPQNLCATNLAYSSRFAYIWSKSGRLQSHMCAGGLKQPSTENKDCASSRVCKAKMQDTGRSTTNDTNKPTVQYQNYNMIRTTYLLTFVFFVPRSVHPSPPVTRRPTLQTVTNIKGLRGQRCHNSKAVSRNVKRK